jgi:hypothetical protein
MMREGVRSSSFAGDWALAYFVEKNPEIELSEVPFEKGLGAGD